MDTTLATPDAIVTVGGLFADDRYTSALRSGFPLHLSLRFELRRTRHNWFDRGIGEVTLDYVIQHDPTRDNFVLDDGNTTETLANPADLRRRLETGYRGGFPPDEPGTYYYRVTLSARTLSDEDVDEVYRWLGGDADSAGVADRNFITRTARRVLIKVAPLPRDERTVKTATFAWP